MKASIVEEIIKQLTPERVEKEIKVIQKVELPLNLQKWIKDYEEVGDRDEFIWKWLYRMFPVIRLPIVSQKYQENLVEIKILLTIFVVQLDDAADQGQNGKLLSELLRIPQEQNYKKINRLSSKDNKYLIYTQKLWDHINKQIKRYPNYSKLIEIFNYDINQVVNAMQYSYLVNKNLYLINKVEYWLYMPHNMAFMAYSMLDLMCSSKSNLKKLGVFREVTWELQRMGRISNWITTQQREIENNDFTSGIFAYAIEENILTSEELKTMSKSKITEKIKKADIENFLFKEWENSYNKIGQMGDKIKPVKVGGFLKGQRSLLLSDLVCKGYK